MLVLDPLVVEVPHVASGKGSILSPIFEFCSIEGGTEHDQRPYGDHDADPEDRGKLELEVLQRRIFEQDFLADRGANNAGDREDQYRKPPMRDIDEVQAANSVRMGRNDAK